jgi:hypothetical protein
MGFLKFYEKNNLKIEGDAITDTMKNWADHCIGFVKKTYEKNIDYSLESIRIIEDILEDEYQQRCLFKDKYDNEVLDFRVTLYSAYIGETMRNKFGGEWFFEPLKDDQPLLEGCDKFVWQMKFEERITKRVTNANGQLYSITSFCNLFFDKFKSAKPGQIFVFDGVSCAVGRIN